MPYYRAQVTIPFDSATATDVATNVWHFHSTEVGTQAQQLDDIENALLGFYTDIDGQFSSEVMSPGRMKFWNLNDPPKRVPLRDDGFIIQPSATAGLPNELSIVLSMRGPISGGVNRRRTRGRVYLGPWDQTTMVAGVGDMKVAQATIDLIRDAVDQWFNPIVTTQSGAQITLSVFSRSDALGLDVGEAPPPGPEGDYTEAQLAAGFYEVEEVSIDNAYDIQRRRGQVASTRTTLTFS